jgi:hypothetical protein
MTSLRERIKAFCRPPFSEAAERAILQASGDLPLAFAKIEGISLDKEDEGLRQLIQTVTDNALHSKDPVQYFNAAIKPFNERAVFERTKSHTLAIAAFEVLRDAFIAIEPKARPSDAEQLKVVVSVMAGEAITKMQFLTKKAGNVEVHCMTGDTAVPLGNFVKKEIETALGKEDPSHSLDQFVAALASNDATLIKALPAELKTAGGEAMLPEVADAAHTLTVVAQNAYNAGCKEIKEAEPAGTPKETAKQPAWVRADRPR